MDVSLLNLHLTIKILEPGSMPPQTSKLIKYAVDKGIILSGIKDLSLSRDKYKPLFISNLETIKGSKIYSRNNNAVKIKPNIVLTGRVAYASRNVMDVIDAMEDLQRNPVVEIRGPYGRYILEVSSIEMISLRNIGMDLSNGFKIVFRTPVLISPKLGLPPTLSAKYSRLKVGYTTQIPGFIFAYSLKLWNSAVPREMRLPRPNDQDDIYVYKAAVLGNALTEVIEHRSICETIVIGSNRDGVLRKARGYRGYMVMNIKHKALRIAMEKTLALANYLGIGRGRGIGLGEVSIKPKT